MPEHRKRNLTQTGGLEAVPAVVFPAPWPSSKTLADAIGIACAPFPSQETGKTISVARCYLNVL